MPTCLLISGIKQLRSFKLESFLTGVFSAPTEFRVHYLISHLFVEVRGVAFFLAILLQVGHLVSRIEIE